jgi:hypothetical protein
MTRQPPLWRKRASETITTPGRRKPVLRLEQGRRNEAKKIVSDIDHEPDQEERYKGPYGEIDGTRIISYNLREGERPGGMKARYKISIVTGPRAREIDARQARVIREVLEWSRQHRQHRGQ